MKALRRGIYHGSLLAVALLALGLTLAPRVVAGDDDLFNDEWAGEELAQGPSTQMPDPIEPLNRVFFAFNDRLYYWFLKPVAVGYKSVVADEDVRTCFSNAFHNLLGPVRIANNLLQGKLAGAGNELAVLVVNSTLGIAGLADPAHNEFGIRRNEEEDMGQTLGAYGMGHGFYICWPILGPSSLRDTVGKVGDSFLDPLAYLTAAEMGTGLAVQGGKNVNAVSLRIGDYEQLKEASFDPYVAVRNAYVQSRKAKAEDRAEREGFAVAGNQAPAAETPLEPLATGAPRGGADVAAGQGEETVRDAFRKGFFVRVGVYVDPDNVEQQRLRLAQLGRAAVVARYARADYSLYGVEVPGGADFLQAKHVEAELVQAGFSETVIVQH